MDTRREFIKKAALLAGATGLSGALPAAIQRALAIDPRVGTTWKDAEHVVILMQENRSFDHCYGTLQGVRGFRDPRAITLPNGNPVWLQTDEHGDTYGPFRLDIKGTNATWMGSLPHNWTNQSDARNEGRYDGWLHAKKSSYKDYADMPLTLGHYTREDVPFYYAMADAFTVCDQTFCSSLTGTTPNRLHLWTGTIRDEQHPDARPRIRNEDTDYEVWAGYTTFPERLEDNGVPWKIYQNEVGIDLAFTEEENIWLSNFEDNAIEYFSQYKLKFAPFYRNALPAKISSLGEEIGKLQGELDAEKDDTGKIAKIKKKLVAKQGLLKILEADVLVYTQEAYDKLSQREKNLHEKAFSVNTDDPHYHELISVSYQDGAETREMKVPKGDVLHRFRADVKAGTLPAVSWLVAPEAFSDHPGSAWYGAWYISEALDILTENPEVWKKTIFILCYDENDGYFDHIPPFVSPHPAKPETGLASEGIDIALEHMSIEQDLQKIPEKEARGGPIGLGYRVPLVVASPWSRGGYVNSQVFDHTSVLMFLEKFVAGRYRKKIEETNINSWRRTVCGDLTSIFRAYQGERIGATAFPGKDHFLESIHQAKFRPLPADYHKLSADEIEQARRGFVSSPLMPEQERGVRPSCALPYQLAVNAMLGGGWSAGERSGDAGKPGTVGMSGSGVISGGGDDHVVITMRVGKEMFGERSAGAPFTIYAYGKEYKTRNYAVKAGDQLRDGFALTDFENGHYKLSVYGPNGYFRAFAGSKEDPPVEFMFEDETGKEGRPTGRIRLKMINAANTSRYVVKIRDNAYKMPERVLRVGMAGTKEGRPEILLDPSANGGWYDYSIRIEGAELFEKRYAGRVETGKDSTSDPAMG